VREVAVRDLVSAFRSPAEGLPAAAFFAVIPINLFTLKIGNARGFEGPYDLMNRPPGLGWYVRKVGSV
jgi:hypothetical protein